MDRYTRSMPYNMIHLCIDEFNDYKIKGKAYNPTLQQPIVFDDIDDAFIQLDNVFNKNGNPLASQSIRSFTKKEKEASYQHKPPVYVNYDELLVYTGEVKTLDIVVKSRRKATWQGLVIVEEKTYPFQTLLELMKIITEMIER